MTAYGLGVESPSVGGLKMDLDRLKEEVNVFLREAKKGAEEYIVHVKEMRARVDLEDELEDAEEDEDETGKTRPRKRGKKRSRNDPGAGCHRRGGGISS